MVMDRWGDQSIQLEAAIKANPDAKVVAFVHAETSTGVRSDAALCRLAKEAGMLVIMDAVTSLAGIDLKADAWGADGVLRDSKMPIGFARHFAQSRRGYSIQARKHKVQSWFLDMNLIMGYWGEGASSYHHTAPVNAVYAIHEALLMLEEEGLEANIARHKANHQSLPLVYRSLGSSSQWMRLATPQLNAVTIPEGVDDASAVASTK